MWRCVSPECVWMESHCWACSKGKRRDTGPVTECAENLLCAGFGWAAGTAQPCRPLWSRCKLAGSLCKGGAGGGLGEPSRWWGGAWH